MHSSASLLAEQSVFAQLVVKKKATSPTKFQKATENETDVYKYLTADNALTSEDPSKYSIINLPDTISFIPQSSIFKNIILIRSSSPDYRFIRVAPSDWMQSSLKRVSIASDSDITVKKFKPQQKTKRKIFTTQYKADKNFNESSSSDGDDEEEDNDDDDYNVDNFQKDAPDDPKFNNVDFSSALNFNNFETDVVTEVAPIITGFKNSTAARETTWYDALLNSYQFNPRVSKSTHKNNTTATLAIIAYLRANITTNNPMNYTNKDIESIKSIIDNYLASY